MLQDRVVLITGATGGLGQVAAREMAAQGARLALVSTNALKLQSQADALNLEAGRVMTHAADLTGADAAAQAVAAVRQAFGRVDVLLHLVGGWTGGRSLTEGDPADLDEMIQQHVWTTLYLAQAVVPLMLSNGWGRIITVSSPSAVRPAPRGGFYAAGKAAQDALVLTLARELSGTGVTANVLQVRTIDTGHERDQARSDKNASWTTPEEITAAALYLCSDAASVVNGARIPLYGAA